MSKTPCSKAVKLSTCTPFEICAWFISRYVYYACSKRREFFSSVSIKHSKMMLPLEKNLRILRLFPKTTSFLKGVFFSMWKCRFGPMWLSQSVFVAWSRKLVRYKAYILKILFHTYNMVLWPLETFLRALEVGCMWFWEAQKELKIMEFELLRESVGKAWVWGRPKLQLEWKCSRIYVRGYEPR